MAAVIICFAGLGLFYYSNLTHEVGSLIGADDNTYVILGQALASGRGYVHLNHPAQPPCVSYPFLFPLLLSAIIAVWGNDYYLMHALVLLCLYLSAIFYVLWLRGFIGLAPALLLGLFAFTLFPVYAQFRLILSEFPYLFFTILGLFLFDRWVRSGKHGPRGFAFFLGACLAAYFTRSVGLALAVAVAAEMIIKPSLRGVRYARVPAWVWFIMIFGALILGWGIRNAVLEKQAGLAGYSSDLFQKDIYRPDLGTIGFRDLMKRYQQNIQGYSASLVVNLFGFLLGLGHPLLFPVFGVISGFIIFLGWLVLVRRGPPGTGLYLVAYLAILLNWPYPERDRFLCPILPLFCICFYYGCRKPFELLENKRPGYRLGFIPAILIFLMLAGDAYFLYHFEQRRTRHRWYPVQPMEIPGIGKLDKLIDFSQFSDWWLKGEALEGVGQVRIANEYIKRLIPREAVILCRSPEFVYLETGRHAVCYLFATDRSKIISQIEAQKVTHVFLMNLTIQDQQYLQPLLASRPDKFKQVFGLPNGQVGIFQVVR